MNKLILILLIAFIPASSFAKKSENVVYNKFTFDFLKTNAKYGDIPTILSLGYIYGTAGEAFGGNESESLMWFMKAAQKGEPSAMYKIYSTYIAREYFNESYQHINDSDKKEIAYKWLKKAAENNYSLAQMELGSEYEKGNLGDENRTLAYEWYKRAADNGYLPAIVVLGAIHEHGNDTYGIKKDFYKAIEWYTKAANNDYPQAQLQLCYLYENAMHSTPKNIQDPVKAYNWCLKAAKNRNSNAQIALSLMYRDGKGVKRDLVEAYAWLKTYYGNNNVRRSFKNTGITELYKELGSGIERTNAEMLAFHYTEKYLSDDVA